MSARYGNVSGTWDKVKLRQAKNSGIISPVNYRWAKNAGIWSKSYIRSPWTIIDTGYGNGGYISLQYPATDSLPTVLQVMQSSSWERLQATLSYPYTLVASDVLVFDYALERDGQYHIEFIKGTINSFELSAFARKTESFTGMTGPLYISLVRSLCGQDGYYATYAKLTIYSITLNGTKIL